MITPARLGSAVLAGLLLAGTAAAPALAESASATPSAPASSPSTAPSTATTPAPAAVPAGLYGKGDPGYDGVWRQSLALTALKQNEVVPAESAVGWLLGQQCADGGWPSFRADTATACDPKTEDSNATAVAVQALVALGGHTEPVAKAVQWFKANQNTDGTWSYNPGSPGDTDSTALAVSALLAAGADPAGVARDGHSAYDGLAGFQLGCASPADQRGAFAYQPVAGSPLTANVLASSQAALAAAGGRLPVTADNRADAPAKPLTCADGAAAGTVARADSASAAAAYLTAKLAAGGQRLLLDTPGATPGPDFNATSWAVLSLVQAGHAKEAASAADWLAGNGYAWAAQGKNGTDPAAAATLLLVARATKLDPYNFGGTNMVQLLIDAGPKPASVPAAAAAKAANEPDATKAPGSGITEPDENGGFSAGWMIGVGLLVGVGGGLLLSLNRRRTTRNGAK
ncbi:prenyltransferase/squalene oxidase repeat-containing protein [Kitasatospora sp. NPDC048365]|uniref:prenyltransferase/squalene oxidase repeat-containing protein n=1 Tax=Kitasatospora sp. NPDC048365 TaxID=3364050 RepID=UPI0037167B4C